MLLTLLAPCVTGPTTHVHWGPAAVIIKTTIPTTKMMIESKQKLLKVGKCFASPPPPTCISRPNNGPDVLCTLQWHTHVRIHTHLYARTHVINPLHALYQWNTRYNILQRTLLCCKSSHRLLSQVWVGRWRRQRRENPILTSDKNSRQEKLHNFHGSSSILISDMKNCTISRTQQL